MIFPTLNFMLFYLLVWPLSWAAVLANRHLLHKLLIVSASYVFYAFWSWRLAFLLLGSVLLNWLVGRFIGMLAARPVLRRIVLGLGVTANLGLLGFFKYYGWFSEELNTLLVAWQVGRELPLLEVVLPIGISFYTFQGISYIVDLYRGDLDRPRPLVDVMFFISFFPHLVAGPIVRAAAFLPQLERPPNPERVFVSLGVLLVVWGVFKKAIVANWLAVLLVDKVFFDPTGFGTLDILVGVYAYAIQIYCDFSAYSDIAIGVAALLGYRFQRNFNQPYRAQSLTDFWRRWHMSLSSWLRDYLYIPLGGSRHGRVRTYLNLFLTMVLGGIWHGAAWKFVVWGALHGSMLVVERMIWGAKAADVPAGRNAIARVLGVLFTFHFVCLCWVFFRASSLESALTLLGALGNTQISPMLITPFLACLVAFGMLIQFTPPDTLQRLDRVYHWVPTWVVGLIAGFAILLIDMAGGDGSAPFIYFQF